MKVLHLTAAAQADNRPKTGYANKYIFQTYHLSAYVR